MSMTLLTRALKNIGVEVLGFDINAPLDEATRTGLKRLWLEHAVLVFRNQDITPARQIRFSRIFGPLESHPPQANVSREYPELFVLENGGAKDRFNTAFHHGQEIVGRLHSYGSASHRQAQPPRDAIRRCRGLRAGPVQPEETFRYRLSGFRLRRLPGGDHAPGERAQGAPSGHYSPTTARRELRANPGILY